MWVTHAYDAKATRIPHSTIAAHSLLPWVVCLSSEHWSRHHLAALSLLDDLDRFNRRVDPTDQDGPEAASMGS